MVANLALSRAKQGNSQYQGPS